MNNLKEWINKNRKTFIFIILYLLLLLTTFLFNKIIFLIIVLLSIAFLFGVFPILYYSKLIEQIVSPEEYYFNIMKTNYIHIKDDILTKMFEIRLNNQRNFLFAYLALSMTFTFAILSNKDYFEGIDLYFTTAYRYFISLGIISILVLVYASYGFDKFTLKELEMLFRAKEKLKQLNFSINTSQMQENMNSDLQEKTSNIGSIKGNSLIENSFGNKAVEFSRNPLGIIALFLVFVYMMAGIVGGSSVLDANQRQIIVLFLVLFPILVLLVFYLLVTKHYNKLYAPSDFSNEANFMRAFEKGLDNSQKFKNLEKLTEYIQKEILSQPFYRYTRLNEAGKNLVLRANEGETIDISTFKNKDFQYNELESQAQILVEYGWITKEGNIVKITKKGKSELSTFLDFCYGRYQ